MTRRRTIEAKLQRALETPSIYRIERRHPSMDRTDGFVVGVGTKWALIARTMDGGYEDGLIALRVRDISSVEEDRSFETAFASTRPQPRPEDLAMIDLEATRRVLASMSSLAPLVAIERERVRADSMWIGEFEGTKGKWFGLREIRPDATWHRKPFAYRLAEVTTVAIRNHYLTALAAVAADDPEKKRR